MPHDATALSTLLLPPLLATSAYAIFGFGRKNKEVEPEPPTDLEPLATDPEAEEDTVDATDTDNEGETLSLLATFPPCSPMAPSEEAANASQAVWALLDLPERTDKDDDSPLAPRLLALTGMDSADTGREALAAATIQLATAAAQLGYSVLVIDADLDHPTLHRMPPFLPQEEDTTTSPTGVAEFLRGDATRLDRLPIIARNLPSLLLLPAGNTKEDDGILTGRATLERMLRLSGSFAEIILLLAPPLLAPTTYTSVQDLLPRANGVIVGYPSIFTATADTEAEEHLSGMDAEALGSIIVPPSSFSDAFIPAEPLPEELSEETPEEIIETIAEEVPEELLPPVETEEEAVEEEAPPLPEPPPAPAPEPPAPVAPVTPSRPSFLHRATLPITDKPRGDARRSLPVETIPADTVAPVRQNRSPILSVTPMPTPIYRPDIALEFLPATTSTTDAALTLRALIGSNEETNGPALLLEVKTLSSEVKRLRAENPGTSASPNAPLLLLEALTPETSPDEVTILRLVVRESGATDAATLLEATLETPDAMRIKSGTAKASGTPPVRFEVTSEPDGTARFRATVPPLGKAPALYVDLDRTVTPEGRFGRISLRLANS